MIVLGIDPGLAITGYGVLEDIGNKYRLLECGCVRTAAGMAQPERLKLIYSGIREIIDKYPLDAVAVEQLFFNTNATTAFSVGQARGVVLLALAQNNIPIFEYTPLQVKQAVVGYGRAEKKQVQRMVQSLLGLKDFIRPDDAADAVSVCICHFQTYRFASAVNREVLKHV